MPKKFRGNFGNLVEAYDKARPSYPHAVMRFILQNVEKNPRILDVGCGTGISTRLLAQHTDKKVYGADIDVAMVRKARSHQSKNIVYKVAPSNALPFRRGSFDVVTAFTAFHWFADKKNMKEILRVLRPGGALVVIGMRIKGTAGDTLKSYLENDLHIELPKTYERRERFRSIFLSAGLKNIRSRKIPVRDSYSLSKYVLYAQSNSRWNFVPRDEYEKTTQALRTAFRKKLKNGRITETRDIEVLIGYKAK